MNVFADAAFLGMTWEQVIGVIVILAVVIGAIWLLIGRPRSRL